MLPRDIALFIKERGSPEAKESIHRNPNGLYNALSRLHNDSLIVKRGDKFYRHGPYEDLSSTDVIDENAGLSALKGSNFSIVDAIKKHGEITPKTITEMPRGSAEFEER